MKKLIVFLFVLICGYGAGIADELQEVVYLKNGSVVRGVIIEQIPGESLKIQTADGSIFAYKMAEVEKMTKEKNPYAAPKRRINNLAAGYKGFIDFGYTFDLSDYDAAKIEFMTSHGYQFSPYFYLGAGIGLHYYTGIEDISVPLFANVRANMMTGNVTPFVDGKIGYSLGEVDGFYFSPSLGCRIAVAERTGINLSLGYVMQCADIYYYGWGYIWGIKTKVVSGLSLKIGVDF